MMNPEIERSLKCRRFILTATIMLSTICGFTRFSSAQTQPGGLLCSVEGYIGQYEIAPESWVYDIQVVENIAYTLLYDDLIGTTQLLAVDFSNSSKPIELGQVDIGDVDVFGIQVDSGNAYLSIDDQGTDVYDISDPAALTLVGSIAIPLGHDEIVIRDDLFYYIDPQTRLTIMDISDLDNPIELGTFETNQSLTHLSVSGERAYISTSSNELLVVNVSDPSSPALIETYMTGMSSLRFSVAADDLLVLFGYGQFEILRTEPGGDELALLSQTATSELAGGFGVTNTVSAVLHDNSILIGTEEGGVLLVSTEQPENPRLLGHTAVPNYDAGIVRVTDSGLTLVTGYEFGISILDMSRADTSIPFSEDWNAINDVEWFQGFDLVDSTIDDQTLYIPFFYEDLKDSRYGLLIVDVADPTSPVPLGAYFSGQDYISHIEVDNQIAFLVRGNGDLEIVDFSNPQKPIQLLQFKAFAYIQDMMLEDGTLWIQGEGNEHILLDVSDTASIDFVAYYKFRSNDIEDAAFHEGLLFLSHCGEVDDEEIPIISVVDLSDPFRPIRVDHIAPAVFDKISVHDGVFIGINDREHTIYTSPITDLQQYGSVPTYETGQRIHVIGDYAYWAPDHHRLIVYDISDPFHPIVHGAQAPNASWFDSVYNDGILMLIGDAHTYSVDLSADCDGCRADLTNDDLLNFFDVSAFIVAHSNADPIADFNNDGELNFFDVSAFLEAFYAGCP